METKSASRKASKIAFSLRRGTLTTIGLKDRMFRKSTAYRQAIEAVASEQCVHSIETLLAQLMPDSMAVFIRLL